MREPLHDGQLDDSFGTPDERTAKLSQLQQGTSAQEALTFFDTLPGVSIEAMLGTWRGSGLPTGHALDGLLELVGWYGKRFESPDQVHPLLMGAPGALFSLNPALVPFAWVRSNAQLVKSRTITRLVRPLSKLLKTEGPQARLRATEFRGVTSAAMLYDALPIQDIFRRVDPSTVLGLMDARGDVPPHFFFFVLRRTREH